MTLMQTELLAYPPKIWGLARNNRFGIESATSFTEDEIQQKIAEAEQFAAEDEERQKKVELRNTADNIVYQTRRTLKESGRQTSKVKTPRRSKTN